MSVVDDAATRGDPLPTYRPTRWPSCPHWPARRCRPEVSKTSSSSRHGSRLFVRVDRESHPFGLHGRKAVVVLRALTGARSAPDLRQRLQLRELLIDLRQLCFKSSLSWSRASASGVCRSRSSVFHSGHECLHRVVVTLRDRVELVVVAARATDAQTQKRLADIGHDFIQRILPCEPFRGLILADLPRQQHRRRDEKSGARRPGPAHRPRSARG